MWITTIELAERSPLLVCLHTVKHEHTSRPRDRWEQSTQQPTCSDEHWATQAELQKHWGSCSNYKTAQTPQRLIFPLAPKQEEEGGVACVLLRWAR